jgi:hypothetical protein
VHPSQFSFSLTSREEVCFSPIIALCQICLFVFDIGMFLRGCECKNNK